MCKEVRQVNAEHKSGWSSTAKGLSGALTSEDKKFDKSAYDQPSIRISSGYSGPIQELCCSRNITPGCVARRCRRKRAARRIQQQKKKKKKGRMKQRKRRRWKRKTEKDREGRISASARSSVDDCTTFRGYGWEYPGGSQEMAAEATASPSPLPSLFLSSSLSGQIR